MEEEKKIISKLEATLEERKGKKGNNYYCIPIKLTPTCEFLVFLDSTQSEVVRLYYANNSKKAN